MSEGVGGSVPPARQKRRDGDTRHRLPSVAIFVPGPTARPGYGRSSIDVTRAVGDAGAGGGGIVGWRG
ncbi:MAG: hypothetical protein VX194_12250, partial [Actinomycetota bacterium]|nr:hypothetical protein [Actinomycetota bacterium]